MTAGAVVGGASPEAGRTARPRRLSRWAREVVAVPVGALALAAAMTWPALRHPTATLPEDVGDPSLVAYLLGWGGHALRTDPGGLWDTNTFFPETNSLAFTDSFLGYAPLGLIGTGPAAAVARYNALFVLVAALAFVGAYALARQLGARWQGALVAGAAFAYAPWRWTQAGHLHVLSTGGIALALAMLARGHGYSFARGYSPGRVRPGWAAAGWAVACWQLLIGFGIGLPFAYVMSLLCLAAALGWLVTGRPRLPRRLVAADLAGGLAFAAVGALMAQPYLRVLETHPYARRTLWELGLYSPPLRGFLVAPDDSLLWGERHAGARAALSYFPEMALFPGMMLLTLAGAGLVLSTWSGRQRLALAGAAVVALVLATGTQGPGGGRLGYLLLFDHLPGWDGIRTPGRLVVWVTLALCLLAAGTVTALVEAAGRHRSGWLPVALLVPALVVVAEGLNTTPHVAVPPVPAAVAQARGPALVLPSDIPTDVLVMLWTTGRYPAVVNGTSAFSPRSQVGIRDVTRTFPDRDSVAYLRRVGVRTVVVLPDRIGGTPWEGVLDRPDAGLGVRRETTGGAVVFRL
jgi:hypothetical protein